MFRDAYVQLLWFFNQLNELTHLLAYRNLVAAKQL